MTKYLITAALIGAVSIVSAAPALAKRIDLPSGLAAYETIPVKAMDDLIAQRIRPGDTLAIRVFGEPELSKDDYVVDTSGFVQVPLAGQVVDCH